MTQFSLFGAAVAEPCLDDLDGVLLAGGHWVRIRRATARGCRSSVADGGAPRRWPRRSRERGVGGPPTRSSPAEGGYARAHRRSRADCSTPRAERWTRGAARDRRRIRADAGGLRLWAIATGQRDDSATCSAPRDADDPMHLAGGAQLARLGIAAVSITARAGGPGWRITSAKRLRRFAELVGEPPAGGDRRVAVLTGRETARVRAWRARRTVDTPGAPAATCASCTVRGVRPRAGLSLIRPDTATCTGTRPQLGSREVQESGRQGDGHQAGDRRVAGEGEDDRRLPRPGVRRRGVDRPHPRPAAQRRRRPGRSTRARRGRASGWTPTTTSSRCTSSARTASSRSASSRRWSRTPTSSTSPRMRTARARPSPGTWSRR